MFSLLDSLTRRLVRRGLRRGLIEGNAPWIAVTIVSVLIRLLTHPQSPRITTENLAVGERIIVTHQPAPVTSRRARRRARGAVSAEKDRTPDTW